MIIDAHVHIGRSEAFRMDADASTLLKIADEAGIDKMFCTHCTALFYNMTEGNDLLGKAMRQHPDRLMGYISIPTPRTGVAARDEIRRCVDRYGMRGLKLYSWEEASLVEEWTWPVLELAGELNLVVLAHISPAECDKLAERAPGTYILMAHMGGHPYAHGDWHKAIAVAKRRPNVLLDTATSQIDNGMIETAVAECGAERVIFGTDTPLLDTWCQKAKVEGARIGAKERDLILGGNIARLTGVGAFS